MIRVFAILIATILAIPAGPRCWSQETVTARGDAPVLTAKQKKLMDDSEKLVKLTAELKVSVDKSSKNELSLDVVRKAETVEKLAKSVKEQIREAR